MKKIHSIRFASPPPFRSSVRHKSLHPTSGAALVISLSLLVLLLGLAMALFLGAGSEVRNASLYKNSQGLRELADSAVNLVQAQIKDATLENATSAPNQRHTWASQPGMIRTYGAAVEAQNSYKLYSWENPRVAGDANDSVPGNWATTPALYVDLNEPSRDPEAPADTDAMRYPIAYPPITGPTAPAGYTIAPTAPLAAVDGLTNPVPMPVQWLYVLQDGAMVYPSAANGTTATIPGASTDNPIVGRIAYWTDDETSKVNLNTAAGGEYWAKPVQKTKIQFENSVWQPTRWEFQRYAGHPARTDLLAVFPDLEVTGDPMRSRHERIWNLIPRVTGNGFTALRARTQAPVDVPYDMDRLFASVGEARFEASGPGAPAEREDFTEVADWADRVERLGFLITTSSRAPETTIYGTPRVSLWPVSAQDTPQSRTALDQLMAFASTIQNTTAIDNPQPYFFQRTTSTAADFDLGINADMLTYLESLSSVTRIPGFGASSLLSKYGQAGRDQILTQMYDYIRIVNKMDRQLPNPNVNSFAWNNTVPPARRVVNGRETYGFGRFPTVNQIVLHFICTGFWPQNWSDSTLYEVDDQVNWDSRAWIATAANVNQEPGTSGSPWQEELNSNVEENLSLRSGTDPATFSALLPGQRNIMAMVYIEVAMPANGYPDAAFGAMEFTIQGLDSLTINGQPLGFPSSATIRTRPSDIAGTHNINTGFGGGVVKYLVFLSRGNNPGTTVAPVGRNGFAGSNSGYPLVSRSVRVSEATMDLGSATIEIGIAQSAGGPSVHTVNIPILGERIPTPTLPSAQNRWVFDQVGWDGDGNTLNNPEGSQGRLPAGNPPPPGGGLPAWEESRLFLNEDAVVGTATAHGDFRISMVRPGVLSNWLRVPFLSSPGGYAHRLHNTSGGSVIPHSNIDNALGLLPVPDANRNLRPPVPPKAELDSRGVAHPLTYGDFDNGLPSLADGAFINAPDELGGWSNATRGLYWTNTLTAAFTALQMSDIFHTPNRKIASAIAFGSLPSAAVQDRPWQTLLFRPAPEVSNHPGRAGFNINGSSNPLAPADFHWLDFFWMPVVEPYAISETFSTAGKINMNYRIEPFAYIRRTTAVEAVLDSGGVIAAPSNAAAYSAGLAGQRNRFRKSTGNDNFDDYFGFEGQFSVNTPETLTGFDNRLNANSLFRSAGELCELPIVPNAPGATFASLSSGSWWMDYRFTGDNTREATYNDIYPRLTTRSNTYTVHHRVQVLKKIPGGNPALWDESRDQVVSEARGSTLIERYLDPNAIYPNYATGFDSAESLETFYRFRVLQRSDFAP